MNETHGYMGQTKLRRQNLSFLVFTKTSIHLYIYGLWKTLRQIKIMNETHGYIGQTNKSCSL